MLVRDFPTEASAILPPSVLSALFWIAAALCVVAQVYILRAVWRVVPSVTGSPSVPVPRRALEMAWAVLPALLMMGAFAGAWRLMHPATPTAPALSTPPSAVSARDIRAADTRVTLPFQPL
jgi:hypothetical protein